MLNISPITVMDFFNALDDFDAVIIEENNLGNDVTLNSVKISNSGNNCIHTDLILNGHRIVIQTYKELNRNGRIDVVQGKPEFEDDFVDFLERANSVGWTDTQLNKLFVLYCGIYDKYVSSCYETEMNSFIIEFGPKMSVCWTDNEWFINVDDVTPKQLNCILTFIDVVKDICNG